MKTALALGGRSKASLGFRGEEYLQAPSAELLTIPIPYRWLQVSLIMVLIDRIICTFGVSLLCDHMDCGTKA